MHRQFERNRASLFNCGGAVLAWVFMAIASSVANVAIADDEAIITTPPGFGRPGVARTASGADSGRVRITVRDHATNQLTPCRINVVGPDGDFYQPALNRLSPYSLTGEWPETGKGNRQGKGPFRYLGRFFYSTGETEVAVPAGTVRIEVWKGFQYQPLDAQRRDRRRSDRPGFLELERTTPMAAAGYYPGDPHLHFPRKSDSRRPDHPRPARSRGYPVRLDSRLQRASRPLHRFDGGDGFAPASRSGKKLGQSPRPDLDRFRSRVPQLDIWASEFILA